MSSASYKRLPSRQCTVKYRYFIDGTWKNREHITFAKTDEEAVASCYISAVWSKHETFHITEIVTKIV